LWRSSNDHVLALDAVGAGRSTTSHPVAALSGCTIIPHSTGTGSGERGQTQDRHLKAKRITGPFTWIDQD